MSLHKNVARFALGYAALVEGGAALVRFRERSVAFTSAMERAIALDRRLVVIGDPDAGFHTRFMRAYGCGDVCVDLNGCPKCPMTVVRTSPRGRRPGSPTTRPSCSCPASSNTSWTSMPPSKRSLGWRAAPRMPSSSRSSRGRSRPACTPTPGGASRPRRASVDDSGAGTRGLRREARGDRRVGVLAARPSGRRDAADVGGQPRTSAHGGQAGEPNLGDQLRQARADLHRLGVSDQNRVLVYSAPSLARWAVSSGSASASSCEESR
jgi:hypothetical protein